MNNRNVSVLEEWFTDKSTDFMRHGNCVGMNVNIFFPYKGESNKEALEACNGRPLKLNEPAKPVCPVKDQCLEYAMSLPTMCVGVWGGKSQKQRRAMKAALERERKAAEAQQKQETVEVEHDSTNPNLVELVRLVSKVHRGEL